MAEEKGDITGQVFMNVRYSDEFHTLTDLKILSLNSFWRHEFGCE